MLLPKGPVEALTVLHCLPQAIAWMRVAPLSNVQQPERLVLAMPIHVLSERSSRVGQPHFRTWANPASEGAPNSLGRASTHSPIPFCESCAASETEYSTCNNEYENRHWENVCSVYKNILQQRSVAIITTYQDGLAFPICACWLRGLRNCIYHLQP